MTGYQFAFCCPIDGSPLVPLVAGRPSPWSTRATARCTDGGDRPETSEDDRRVVGAVVGGPSSTELRVSAETFWNGEPADALRCKVLIPRHSWPLWLDADASPLRHAVRIQQYGYKFFIDNEDGSGWAKVTNGRGSPHYGHRELPVGCVVSSGDSNWEPSGDAQ